MDNANYFRAKLTEAGFDLKPSESAICALMLYDAVLSQQFAAELQKENIYVTGFYYPVVPKGQARIRINYLPLTHGTTGSRIGCLHQDR